MEEQEKYKEKERQLSVYKQRLEKAQIKYLEQISELSGHQDELFMQLKEER